MVLKIKFRLFTSLLVVALGFSLVSVVPKSLADSGTIYFSPSSETETAGSTFTVDVEVNPGTSINAIQVAASYDSSMLQYDSSTPVTFTLCAQNTGGSGSVSMGCAGSATSSQIEVAAITFTALVGSGSTSISLGGSYAASGGSSVSLSPEDATISFYTPASPSSGSGSTGTKTTSHSTVSTKSSSASAGSGSTTPIASTTTTATPVAVALPKISINSTTVKPNLTTASISVISSSAVQTIVNYGESPASLSQSITSTGESKTNVLKLSNLSPATAYYYQVEDIYSGTVISTSHVQTFTTKGFSLNVIVLDSQYKPLANQVVYLHSTPIKAVTNSKGVATFSNVPSGVHHLDYTNNGKSYSEVLYVSNTVDTSSKGIVSAPLQTQSVVLSGFITKSSNSLSTVLLTLILLLILAFAFISITSNGRRSQIRSFMGSARTKK